MKLRNAMLLKLVMIFACVFGACKNHDYPCKTCLTQECFVPDQVINGKADICDAKFNTLTINGKASLDNVVVQKDTVVNGHAEIVNSTFNILTVHGKASLKKVTVQKDSMINGRAVIADSTLQGLTTVRGAMSIVNSTTAQLILYTAGTQTIEYSTIASLKVIASHPDQDVTVELIDTTINGDVQFDGTQKATLVLKGTAQVKGNITGVRVQRN